ncbi:MAG: hypothetical protein ACRDF0_10905, partial [Candidatus Limnocylindria bacterium]
MTSSVRAGAGGPAARAADDPFSGSVLRSALVALVSLKIMGLLLIFDPGGAQAFDLPKSLFSRAVEWLIAATLLLSLASFGPRIVPRTRLHAAAAAVLLATALSAAFAEQRYLALFGEQERYLGLTFVVDMALLYLAVAVAFRDRADWALLSVALALASVVVCAYALLQAFGLDPVRWSGPASLAFSTLGHNNFLGQFLSVAFAAAAAFAVLPRRHPRLARAGGLGLA